MSEMAPNLDDMRFQQLVDVARQRIKEYCPEWTDYNLSDPGITLIELFAWMTENLIYRLNRVPEKNYLKFLEMMKLFPQPPSSARAELTFYLSAPFPITPGEDLPPAKVPQESEVTTSPSEGEQEITFTTDNDLVLGPPRLVELRKESDERKNYLSSLDRGIEVFYAFNPIRPAIGDTFYLGFADTQNISGYILRLTFDCEEAQAVGVNRNDPPWVWECSLGDKRWKAVPLSPHKGEEDTSGGLNNTHGSLVLHLPLNLHPDKVHGRSAYWLRCRLVKPHNEEQGMYSESPRIKHLEAHTLGGTIQATQASHVPEEILGFSNGEPGQNFRLQHYPVLALMDGEFVEIEEKRDDDWVFIPWTRVADFSESDRSDRHFVLDETSGEVQFGPGIRQPNGDVRQYGRVPETGRRIRFSHYRFGGGSAGNVPAEKIRALRSAVPYIDRVTNFEPAEGGRDQESLEEVKMRARRELRAQERAVTAEDFEALGRASSREVARTRCLVRCDQSVGDQPGVVELLVVPAIANSVLAGDLSSLALDPGLITRIQKYLDERRLLTTILRIRQPTYIVVKVQASIVVSEYSQEEKVFRRVNQVLRRYLSPLSLSKEDEQDEQFGAGWEGWPFGRDLYAYELYSLIQKEPGVKHVMDVQLSYQAFDPGKAGAGLNGSEQDLTVSSASWIPVTEKKLTVPADTTLCSLDHDIRKVEL